MPETKPHHPPHPLPSKRERMKKIKAIQSELAMKRRELGLDAPKMQKGPTFYLVLLAVLGIVGFACLKASSRESAAAINADVMKATKSVDAFAEALGRYKFHCGVYPTAEEGLDALAIKESRHEGWIGPYIKRMKPDPWNRAYIYEPTNEPPVLLSLGPDGIRGTPDDIAPDPARFTKPFTDTTWTNKWAPYTLRGYIVIPSKKKP